MGLLVNIARECCVDRVTCSPLFEASDFETVEWDVTIDGFNEEWLSGYTMRWWNQKPMHFTWVNSLELSPNGDEEHRYEAFLIDGRGIQRRIDMLIVRRRVEFADLAYSTIYYDVSSPQASPSVPPYTGPGSAQEEVNPVVGPVTDVNDIPGPAHWQVWCWPENDAVPEWPEVHINIGGAFGAEVRGDAQVVEFERSN